MPDQQSSAVVYVVTTGSYDDLCVQCACPTEQDAQTLAARMGYGSEAEVLALEVHPGNVAQVSVLHMRINLYDDGSERDEYRRTSVEWPWSVWPKTTPDGAGWRWVRAPMHHGLGGRLDVWGTDHERVRKMYDDMRAMLKTDDAMRARTQAQG
jgi:hypothetical protein